MKSTHNKAEQQKSKEIKYPCLMVSSHSGNVVLFNSYESGIVVLSKTADRPAGSYSKDWSMGNFTPLPPNESITLQND